MDDAPNPYAHWIIIGAVVLALWAAAAYSLLPADPVLVAGPVPTLQPTPAIVVPPPPPTAAPPPPAAVYVESNGGSVTVNNTNVDVDICIALRCP